MAHTPSDVIRRILGDDEPGDRDRRDVLSGWERENFFGADTVQLRIPLRDPGEARRHPAIIEEGFRSLRLRLEQGTSDRSDLLLLRSVVKGINQKLNAYRNPRR